MCLFSMGPKPMVNGHQVLYEPPYAWLLRLPLFGTVRVPARFAMPAILALSASGALAFSRFRLDAKTRRFVAPLLMAGILADGWIAHLPLPTTPDFWPPPKDAGFSAVLELPLGDTFGDIAAMYRAIGHSIPVANGNSGFAPAHYFTLRTALDEYDLTVLDGFGDSGQLLIALDAQTTRDASGVRCSPSTLMSHVSATRQAGHSSAQRPRRRRQRRATATLCRSLPCRTVSDPSTSRR